MNSLRTGILLILPLVATLARAAGPGVAEIGRAHV